MIPERLAASFVQIFRKNTRVGDRRHTILDHDRCCSRRVERQEFCAAIPRTLFDELHCQSVFRERQTRKPRKWAERVVKQRQHCGWDQRRREAGQLLCNGTQIVKRRQYRQVEVS